MDPIRTLLLARTHTVILDPDRVASAATRPSRDGDVDQFEDELAQLGFVMSLDLAMTIRRLPAPGDRRAARLDHRHARPIARHAPAARAAVPRFPAGAPADAYTLYRAAC